MKALLVTYLWVTGIGAAVVLAAPWLVALGLFLLIVPGIILGLLPTAFLYGVVFALVWFPLHGLAGEWPAAVVAALVSVGVMFVIPIAGNRVTDARYRAELAGDMLPAEPIALAGHVRIDDVTASNRKDVDRAREQSARRGGKLDAGQIDRLDKQCGDLCLALLFTDGVESVTVNHDRSGNARDLAPTAATYRLLPRADCTTTLLPSGNNDHQWGGWEPTLPDLQNYWKLRLSTDRCLVREPTRTVHDWQIVASSLTEPLYEDYKGSNRVSLGPRSVQVRRLEIFDGAGQGLLRQTRATAKRITQPLVYAPGGDLSAFRFGWNAAAIGPRYGDELKAITLLATHARLNIAVDKSSLAAGIRDQLAAVLADPDRTIEKPTVDIVPAFLASMDKRAVPTAEIDLALRLIGDRRFTNFDSIDYLRGAMPDGGAGLRAPLVDRLLTADAAKERSLKALGGLLRKLPAGLFAALTPNEATLLADPARRTLAAGLIYRQADRGAAAAPLLAGIVTEQLALQAAEPKSKKSWEVVDHAEAFRAAIDALSDIGPAANSVLGPLDDLAARGAVFRGLRESDSWNVMLIRLGKPVTAIPKPDRMSGSADTYHARLRRAVERFERDLARRR